MRKIYLIGAGPGDPGLITVRGMEILRKADVVIYDRLANTRLLDYTKEGVELICRKNAGKILLKKVKEGKKVIRLKNGDPSIFGRLYEEIDFLSKNKIDFEIIPGVTAASYSASCAGISLTDRRYSSSVIFVTGHESEGKKSNIDWKAVSRCGTIVLYMAVKNIGDIAEKLIASGKKKNTAVIIVSGQKLLKARLDNAAFYVKKYGINPPAVFIVTEKAEFKKSRKILFTGLSDERYFLYENYVHVPLIKIVSAKDYKKLDAYIKKIKQFDWIVFTSRYGVEYFFKRMKAAGVDSRELSDIKIAVIGSSTKEKLSELGILPDLMPKKESSAGLIEEFRKIDLRNKKLFLPRSDISDKGLVKVFGEMGAFIAEGIAYRNIMPENLPDLDLEWFSKIMFTSPSGVRNFVKRYGYPPKKVIIKCIGDVTKKQAEKLGLDIYGKRNV